MGGIKGLERFGRMRVTGGGLLETENSGGVALGGRYKFCFLLQLCKG